MRILKEINTNEIKKKAEDINLIKQQLHDMKIELNELIAESANDYYGTECSSAYHALHQYLRDNSTEYETEDGYKVVIDYYHVYIKKQFDDVTVVGETNCYDKPYTYLSISIDYRKSNRKCQFNTPYQMPLKYKEVVDRMLEIEEEIRIFDPYKEFEDLM